MVTDGLTLTESRVYLGEGGGDHLQFSSVHGIAVDRVPLQVHRCKFLVFGQIFDCSPLGHLIIVHPEFFQMLQMVDVLDGFDLVLGHVERFHQWVVR